VSLLGERIVASQTRAVAAATADVKERIDLKSIIRYIYGLQELFLFEGEIYILSLSFIPFKLI
jgi:hypothetical protein